MRYLENKERSTEILRLALPLMARQVAAFHPLSYALWYEHCAGINPDLSRVLDGRLTSNTALSEADVWRLYAQHIAARDMEAFERLQLQLRKLLEDTAQSASTASHQAAKFGESLEGHARELADPQEPDAVRQIVSTLLEDTQRMQVLTSDLSEKLLARTNEVNALTENLRRAQTEALLDSLTGLKNRRGLERAIEDLQREPPGLLGSALLLADIDHFKTVNDTYGHVLGDKVIRAVAHVLRSSIKGRDVAARLGGEEFAVLLPQTSVTGAAAVAEQIRDTVAQGRICRPDGNESIGQVTLSVGVAVAKPGDTMEALLERADAAMYAAKRAGRNKVSVAGEGAAAAVSYRN
ncbi:MAG: GGDEF domain-containing protein [Sinobacteraceae bacterium]|nr:GGDEF domain-containing protein [Nevskiaceae bacterium]